MLICTTGIASAEEKKVDVNLSNIRTVETHIQFNNFQKAAGSSNISTAHGTSNDL